MPANAQATSSAFRLTGRLAFACGYARVWLCARGYARVWLCARVVMRACGYAFLLHLALPSTVPLEYNSAPYGRARPWEKCNKVIGLGRGAGMSLSRRVTIH